MYVKEDLVEDQMMATIKDHLAVIRFDLQRNINYVSEPFAQTNMLAINASIEAAYYDGGIASYYE